MVSKSYSEFFSYLIYFLILIVVAVLLVYFLKKLPSLDMPKGKIKTIDPVNDGMMITYFGLFFFALSVTNVLALIITFIILVICVMCSNVYMFNPLFSILRYKFYYITFESGKKCLLLSRENFSFGDDVKFDRLHKLNEFTYID